MDTYGHLFEGSGKRGPARDRTAADKSDLGAKGAQSPGDERRFVNSLVSVIAHMVASC